MVGAKPNLVDGLRILCLPLVHCALHVPFDDVFGDVVHLGLGEEEGEEGVGDNAVAAHLHSIEGGVLWFELMWEA